jgi:glycerol-3-phosphate dehydrogenase
VKIRVLGGGWYGCHIALALIGDGHEVEIHETRERIFEGASGSIPARLHLGFHYPRSRMTRAACQAFR